MADKFLMWNCMTELWVSLALWDHTVLLATLHKRTQPALTPSSKAGTLFTYPRRTEGWVDLGILIMPRSGVEPATDWLNVWRPNRIKTPLYDYYTVMHCRKWLWLLINKFSGEDMAICPGKDNDLGTILVVIFLILYHSTLCSIIFVN